MLDSRIREFRKNSMAAFYVEVEKKSRSNAKSIEESISNSKRERVMLWKALNLLLFPHLLHDFP